MHSFRRFSYFCATTLLLVYFVVRLSDPYSNINLILFDWIFLQVYSDFPDFRGHKWKVLIARKTRV